MNTDKFGAKRLPTPEKKKTPVSYKLKEAFKVALLGMAYVLIIMIGVAVAVLGVPLLFMYLTDVHDAWFPAALIVWLIIVVGIGTGIERYKEIK